jgi:outer membrane protein TolC
MIRPITFFLAVVWPGLLFAQEPLTLREAIQDTLAHNRSLQGAQAGVREADAQATQARAAYFPRISFTEGWQRGDQPVFVFSSLLSSRQFTAANFAIDSLNQPSATGFFRGAVSVQQMLFDGGRTSASVTSAGLQRDVARLSADEAAAGLILAVTQVYGRVLAATATMKAADAAAAAAQEDLTRATLRRDAGSLSDADVLAVAVHLSETRQRRIQAAGDAAVAKAELNRLMGSPIDRQYAVLEPNAAAPAPRETPSLAALFAEAETARPDLKRAAAAEQLAEENRRQARGAWYPQIAAQAGIEANGTTFTDRASSWIVGGEFRWSFSTGGAENAQQKAAVESGARAHAAREDARAAAQVEIVTAVQQLESARARQAVGRAAVEQARESQRIIRDRFEAGLASTSDVLRTAAAVSDAETQRVSALVDAIVSSAMLDRALGRNP